MKQWLETAGRFTVEHIGGIPHFNQSIDASAPPTGILHTTEGEWDGALAIFKQRFAPHFLLGMDKGKVRIAQLVQIGTIGAALVTHNWVPIVQIEMIGFSKESLWRPDDETCAALASLMAVCKAEYGIPLTRAWPDSVYGRATASSPHRAEGKFGHVAGWYGHGDCPAPDSHWDPGELQWSYIFALAATMPESGMLPSPPAPVPVRPCVNQNPTPPDVKTIRGLQQALRMLGYNITVDGDYGHETSVAVTSFQMMSNIVADGRCGPQTEAAMLKALSSMTHKSLAA